MISSKWLNSNDDLAAVKNLLETIHREELNNDLQAQADDSYVAILAVYDNDNLCGTGRIARINETHYLISDIAVPKSKRNCGYGDFTVRMLIRKCFNAGATEVFVNSLQNLTAFYEKLGFATCENDVEGNCSDFILMSRKTDVSGNCCNIN